MVVEENTENGLHYTETFSFCFFYHRADYKKRHSYCSSEVAHYNMMNERLSETVNRKQQP